MDKSSDDRQYSPHISRSVSVQSIETLCSNSSNNSKESVFCRICHQNDSSETDCPELISPCNCMGSMANVHQHCLQRWASITSTSSCDICGFNYSCRKKYPSFLKVNKSIDFLFSDKNLSFYCLKYFIVFCSVDQRSDGIQRIYGRITDNSPYVDINASDNHSHRFVVFSQIF